MNFLIGTSPVVRTGPVNINMRHIIITKVYMYRKGLHKVCSFTAFVYSVHLKDMTRPYKWLTTLVNIIQDSAFKFINALDLG